MLDVDDVAAKCKVSRDTVRKWRATGVGPRWHRLGKHLRCEQRELAAWIKARAVVPAPADHPKRAKDDAGGWD